MPSIGAEPVRSEADAPGIRLRIEDIEPQGPGPAEGGRTLTLTLTVKEAIAARDALNRALNDLGLPDQE